MKKLVLLVIVLLLFSCGRNPKPEATTTFDTNFEILNGKVKQLSEIYKNNAYSRPDTSITDFDVHGNAIQTRIKGDCNCLIKYNYRYDKNGRKIEVVAKNDERLFPFIYQYGVNGRIVKLAVDTKEIKDESPWNKLKQDISFYRYDTTGDRIQDDGYSDTLHRFQERLRYNNQHILMQSDYFYQVRMNDKERDLLNKRSVADVKTIYQYKKFDAKGNWLKRLAVKHSDPSFYMGSKPKESIETYVESRQITYY